MLIQLPIINDKKRRLCAITKYSRKTLGARVLEMTFLLLMLSFAHIVAMIVFESLALGDAVWLTATTLVTVGYGDVSAQSVAGRLSTVILIYAAGITVFAELAGRYIDWRQSCKNAIYMGKRKWVMRDHIVFLNCPQYEAETYFKRLISAFRQSTLDKSSHEVLIISEHFAPDGIADDILDMGIAHVSEPVTSATAFDHASLDQAAVVVVMTQDEYTPLSDSVTYDLVSRVREYNPHAIIIAEIVDDRNKNRIKAVGANHIIRPLRAYPEMVVRTILAPGTECVIEELFDSEGEEVARYDVALNGKWGEIQARFILEDVGTPLAYVAADGQVILNQKPDAQINDGKAVFVVMREGNYKSPQDITKALAQEIQLKSA